MEPINAVALIERKELAENFLPIFTSEVALERYQAFKDFVSRVLKVGVDYGKVPGSDRHTLLKPGAEKLCTFFGLTPRYVAEVVIEDWSGEKHGEPLFYYRFKCLLFRGTFQMGEGIGSSSNWESKHRYRWVDEATVSRLGLDKQTLPTRGGPISEFEFAINKAETSGAYAKPAEYWDRWRCAVEEGVARRIQKAKKDGTSSPAYEMNATFYRVPNAEFADIINTVQKIAQKRAYVAATLSATNASDYFTQDLEDYIDVEATTPEVVSIDIGQNAPNTRGAQQHVLQQKLQALKQDATTVTDARVIPQTSVPEEVLLMWGRMISIETRCQEFAALKAKLVEVCGEEEGLRRYRQKLLLYVSPGADGKVHSNQIAKNAEKSRKCALEMSQTIQNYQRASAEEATEEDIPR